MTGQPNGYRDFITHHVVMAMVTNCFANPSNCQEKVTRVLLTRACKCKQIHGCPHPLSLCPLLSLSLSLPRTLAFLQQDHQRLLYHAPWCAHMDNKDFTNLGFKDLWTTWTTRTSNTCGHRKLVDSRASWLQSLFTHGCPQITKRDSEAHGQEGLERLVDVMAFEPA